jgi:tetracycline resistance efflux pump
MQGSWPVVIPPIIVIFSSYLTRRVAFSISIGILSGFLILHDFCISKALPAMAVKIWETMQINEMSSWGTFCNANELLIILFTLVLGILIEILRHSGGVYAYLNFTMKFLKEAKHAEMASLSLSSLFFLDDYFSGVTVGAVMYAITDYFKIARAKLGLLVSIMASSLVVIFPITCWTAIIMGQFDQSGISSESLPNVFILSDSFFFYIGVIPFIFYAFIAVFSIWFLVLKRISFGLLKKHEKIAKETGDLFGGKQPPKKNLRDVSQETIAKSSIFDFLFPLFLLIFLVFAGVLLSGDFVLFGGKNGLVAALQNGKTPISLFLSSVTTTIVSSIFLIARKKLHIREMGEICCDGISLMGSAIATLVLIWTFGSLLNNNLAIGKYLATLVVGKISVCFLPVMFFIVSAITAIAMGSAWGVMGIYIPIALPMLFSLINVDIPAMISVVPISLPLMGAIISGSVVGSHMSPISDTTLISSIGSGANHMDLIKIQQGFAFPCVVAAAISFLISGILFSYGFSIMANSVISLLVGLFASVGFFCFIKWAKK